MITDTLATTQVLTQTAIISDTLQITETPTPTRPPISAAIYQPAAGQAVQGSLLISGTTMIDGFAAAELSFSYSDDPTHTWFLIADLPAPVTAGRLAEWDTTTLTDGNYTLRLLVIRQDGNKLSFTVPGLRVRNYSPVETPTASPSPVGATAVPPTSTSTPTPTVTPIMPTPTPLPTNPVEITGQEIQSSAGRGAAAAFGVFAALGLLAALRKRLRRN